MTPVDLGEERTLIVHATTGQTKICRFRAESSASERIKGYRVEYQTGDWIEFDRFGFGTKRIPDWRIVPEGVTAADAAAGLRKRLGYGTATFGQVRHLAVSSAKGDPRQLDLFGTVKGAGPQATKPAGPGVTTNRKANPLWPFKTIHASAPRRFRSSL